MDIKFIYHQYYISSIVFVTGIKCPFGSPWLRETDFLHCLHPSWPRKNTSDKHYRSSMYPKFNNNGGWVCNNVTHQ